MVFFERACSLIHFTQTLPFLFQIMFHSPVILKTTDCSGDSLPSLHLQFKDSWDIPSAHLHYFSSASGFYKLVFRSQPSRLDLQGVDAVGSTVRVDYLSPLLWPVSVHLTCTSQSGEEWQSGIEEGFNPTTDRYSAFSFTVHRSFIIKSNGKHLN